MAAPRHAVSADEVARQLSTERQLRFATEQTLKDLRRDNARLAAMHRTRTHYVVFIPKPKWSVLYETLKSWGYAAAQGARRGWAFLKQALWPEVSGE
jgi:hypothetical protein